MGLPEIVIDFRIKSSTAITRSSRGVVAMILKDDTDTSTINHSYTSVTKIEDDKFNEESRKYIDQVFKSEISKLLILRVTDDNTLDLILANLSKESFDYVCYPGASVDDNTKIVSWIKGERKKNRIYKAVLAETEGDHEGIINYVSTCVDINGNKYTPDKYTPRIAGVLASMPLNMSSTYYKLSDLQDAINTNSNLDNEIDNGKLLLIKDDGIVKISRGVNSLATTSKSDLKKIRIVEIMDMIKSDIHKTLKDNYIGKVSNTYENKIVCISTINSYLDDLYREGVLGGSNNKVDIDVEAHKAYLKQSGKTDEQINSMTHEEIMKCNTGSNLYLTGEIMPIDCMEDIKIIFSI